ncbi:hypothetical protein DV737_g1046, partial [Chaetothyriales sp. CBS 132003]
MLRLPREIQNQIYEEYFGSHKFDLVVEDIGEPAKNARDAHRNAVRGFTGRLVIRCTETGSVRCLKWFMGKCQPYLRKHPVPDWVRTLTTTVAIPEHWTWIHNGGQFFDRGIWRPLLELFPRMNTLETICKVSNWDQPEPRDLDIMLTETQYANPFYVFEIVTMTASIPTDRRSNFKFIQSYICGSYAAQQPDIDGCLRGKAEGLPKQFAFSGEILNVWDLGDMTVPEKQRVIKMTDRIAYNVDADSAEPESSLVFRTSLFLAWSHKMAEEEEQSLDQATRETDEEFMRQRRGRCLKESPGSRPKATQRTPSQRKYSSWKPNAELEVKRQQLAQTLAHNLL